MFRINLVILIINKMARCAQTLCGWVIIIAVVYFIGFNNILDFISAVVDHIPLLSYPLSWGLSVVRYVGSFFSFYYIYALVIMVLNVLYQVFIYETTRRRRGYTKVSPPETLYLMVIVCLLPTLVSALLINWNLVLSLFVPLHATALINHVLFRCQEFRLADSTRAFAEGALQPGEPLGGPGGRGARCCNLDVNDQQIVFQFHTQVQRRQVGQCASNELIPLAHIFIRHPFKPYINNKQANPDSMGSSHIKDENIQIFMQLHKQFYLAGDTVEGEVYLQARKPSQYARLVVGVEGEEYVYWSEGGGNSKRYYKNRYNSYNSYFVVMDFNGLVQQGDYVFPFAFLLPSAITGSFFHSKHDFLKYTIKCELVHPSQARRSQFYEMFLNILEPPRNPFLPLSLTNTVNSKCCTCCCSYGITSATMNCDRNFVLNGDLVQVSGCVDNGRGTERVDSTRVVFERKRFMVSSGGHVRDTVEESFELHRLGAIQPGGNANFNFTGKIPDSLVICTAIGKITAMYYLLHLYTDYGCCANKAEVKLHLIFHSRTPMIVKPQLLPQPSNWYPHTFPKVLYQNMSPYLYVPDPRVPFLNQPTGQMMMGLDSSQGVVNGMLEEMGNNGQGMKGQGMEMGASWGNNYSYQPVFYNEEMVSDAQREHLADRSQDNAIFRQL